MHCNSGNALINLLMENCCLSVRTSPGGWRDSERLFEGAGKSGLGTVTDQVSNLRKGRASIAELLGRDLHAPIGDVVHRPHADQGAFMSIAIAKRSSDTRFSIYCRSTSLSLVSSRPS